MLTKAEELVLRRAAERHGMKLIKSMTRDRRNPTHNHFMLVDGKNHEARLGGRGPTYQSTPDEVRDYLARLDAAESAELDAA